MPSPPLYPSEHGAAQKNPLPYSGVSMCVHGPDALYSLRHFPRSPLSSYFPYYTLPYTSSAASSTASFRCRSDRTWPLEVHAFRDRHQLFLLVEFHVQLFAFSRIMQALRSCAPCSRKPGPRHPYTARSALYVSSRCSVNPGNLDSTIQTTDLSVCREAGSFLSRYGICSPLITPNDME